MFRIDRQNKYTREVNKLKW